MCADRHSDFHLDLKRAWTLKPKSHCLGIQKEILAGRDKGKRACWSRMRLSRLQLKHVVQQKKGSLNYQIGARWLSSNSTGFACTHHGKDICDVVAPLF